MSHPPVHAIADVCDVEILRGADANADNPPDLLLEVPHGATRAQDFVSLRARIRSELPEGLDAFFFVNTDAGAPEVALAVAQRVVTLAPELSVLVLRCRIPRTFVDTNREMDVAHEALYQVGLTPGIPPYIRDPHDLELLHRLYRDYQDNARRAYAWVCGNGGAAIMLHSYAPRSVDVVVDDDIVRALRRAYEPEVFPTWPLRPEVDLIVRPPDGEELISPDLVARVADAYLRAGVAAERGTTYPLHPSTTAWAHARRYPGRALCLEIRRDLLADPFTPFAEMRISPSQTARLAAPLADGWLGWWRAKAV